MAKEVKHTSSKAGRTKIARGEIVAKVIFPEAIWKEEKAPQPNVTLGKAKSTTLQEESAIYETADAPEKAFPKIINDDRNFYRLVNATRKGLPYKSLRNAQVMMPFSTDEWAQMLHVSKRSIDRLKKEKKKLNRSQSEKLIEVTLLYDYGIDVFSSAEKFSKWLNRSSIALGGVVPKSLLDTNQGIKAIKTELSRIEYGVLA